MSLLMSNQDTKLVSIARKVFDKQFENDPKLDKEYDDHRKKLMYEDILINLSYLDTAIEFEDSKIFGDYAIWIYQLLCYIMKDLSRDRIKDQMIMHYQILNDSLSNVLLEAEAKKADQYIKDAIELTKKEAIMFNESNKFQLSKYIDVNKKYLDYLLNYDTQGAYKFVESLIKTGYTLEEIYIDILQEVMHEVGNLWQRQEISVDKEHYCTSTTQVILSQFYPLIFSSAKKGAKILTCTVGSELHEMGARMISDLFEFYGWDSIYLGAAVPNEFVLKAIEENKPDLIALSVTMPQHLTICHDLVKAIKAKNINSKIAVGGRGFNSSAELWKKWEVDISTDNALELVQWAEINIIKKMEK
ncbi:MAG: cobalamin B12-binding domain-containing protein [Fusobacteria bacterium]|nr:MAG: cobalamin B12-binding domain-containing protein [Fusobacteriota bacterium]KAF0229977.1 MAG: cobalamin B12-binding domain-containing [Fusobacteriota bacterium]